MTTITTGMGTWRQIQRDAGEEPVPPEPEAEAAALLLMCAVLGAEPIEER